ncbi:YciI family protein [Micromonospora rubida]|uniref:YciI family protein n=1 Tax=Micromonospora rubida TaxID=2697657 RepID=A0ABW7SFW1_9ACTN
MGEEGIAMRYCLLLHNLEPTAGEIPEETIAAAQQAFQAYARDLEVAGVLRSADVLQPSTASTTVTLRAGNLQVQDGPFADTKEALAGVFVIDVEDLDAALAWAERCPGAQYGTVEVRPTAIAFLNGQWTK